MTTGLTLVPYDGSCAARVVYWCAASPYSRGWVPAGTDPDAVLAGWHTDPDITGYLLLRDGDPVAYGELWVEVDEDEAEFNAGQRATYRWMRHVTSPGAATPRAPAG